MLDKIVIISGPTAAGKSQYAIEIAQAINGEIISADSMQIYRGLDIGTAKIKHAEQEAIPHYLLDVAYPNEQYSVADYQAAARQKIEQIIANGKTPIIVGGTGLYIQSTVFDYQFDAFEQELDYDQYNNLSLEMLSEKLQALDLKTWQNVDLQNRRRVVHAIVLAEQSMASKSEREAQQQQKLLYDIYPIAICPPRDILYERINQRVHQMIEAGLIAEVHYFKQKYQLSPSIQRAIGYREVLEQASDELQRADVIASIQQNTRKFAKRQLTWIRNQKINYKLIEEAIVTQDEIASIMQFLQA